MPQLRDFEDELVDLINRHGVDAYVGVADKELGRMVREWLERIASGDDDEEVEFV